MAGFDFNNIPLGKPTAYIRTHSPHLLFAIPRQLKRDEINVTAPLPFTGADLWTAYELTWLEENGKPRIAIAEFSIACDSVNLIESKSFKLYLNSFSQTKIRDTKTLVAVLTDELSAAAQGKVSVNLILPSEFSQQKTQEFSGLCLDELTIRTDVYSLQSDFLATENTQVNETVYSNLLGSICPITQQPDWGSVLIRYQGNQINHIGLLKYIISYREHGEFHEQCVERIFRDITQHCQPQALTVYARYTRRGGLDINPFRSNFESVFNLRTYRQ